MAEIPEVQVLLERLTKRFVEMDSFHLSRLTPDARFRRVRQRIQEEMMDARYNSPTRMDPLGVDARNLAIEFSKMRGPQIEVLLQKVIPIWVNN